jgi:hypothetical protein
MTFEENVVIVENLSYGKIIIKANNTKLDIVQSVLIAVKSATIRLM